MAGIVYSVRKNRLEQAKLRGFEIMEKGGLSLSEGTSIHCMFLRGMDSAIPDADWTRLHFDIAIPENMTYYTYVFTVNDNIYRKSKEHFSIDDFLTGDASIEEKKLFLEQVGALRSVGKNDLLLFGMEGRYLYLAIEVQGTGEGYLTNIRVERESDSFMEAFPEVYRENNPFFRRYISIFSSIYNDFDANIDALPELLDLDKCPRECLSVFISWMGIDVDGDFLREEVLRTLVREAYKLNRLKGTRACLERLVEIFLDEKPLILEQNMIKAYEEKGGVMGEAFQSGSIYDVNILIKKRLSETERFQMLYLIDQFKPLRARIHLIQLRDGGLLDSNVYLDLNAKVEGTSSAALDDSMGLSENIVLQ